VRLELQADCYAGIWATIRSRPSWLEQGDIESAINAAQQIGDDTLQRSRQAPCARRFTHGSSAQRALVHPGPRPAAQGLRHLQRAGVTGFAALSGGLGAAALPWRFAFAAVRQ
jgi:hypothetical protein